MYWLRTSFKDWATKQGIELLSDDLRYIEKILNKLPKEEHKQIMKQYTFEWLDGFDEADIPYQKQSLGRIRANRWLAEKLE